MSLQTLKMGWGDKIVVGLMTVFFLVAGFFASLLALAIGGAMGLLVMAKLWRARRRAEKGLIDAEYHVIHD